MEKMAKKLKAEYTEPANSAAHHIVPAGFSSGARDASPARKVLKTFNIDINSWENGILLPKSTQYARPPMLTHSTLHTKEYIRYVNTELGKATSRSDAIRTIANIRSQLITGKIKW